VISVEQLNFQIQLSNILESNHTTPITDKSHSERINEFFSCTSDTDYQKEFEEQEYLVDKEERNSYQSEEGHKQILTKTPPKEVKVSFTMAEVVPVEETPVVEVVNPVAESTSSTPVKEESPNVSQNLYDGFKAVWGYGCGITIAKPFLDAGESVAGKVLNMATGINLEKGDEEIKPKLAELDDNVINPAIVSFFEAIAPIVGKADETIRPVITILVKKLYFIPFVQEKEPVKAESAAEQ